MREIGLSKEEVIQELRLRLEGDLSFTDGRILGSMCTYPHEFAQLVFLMNIEKNLGDPGLFPQTAELEKETISMLGELLSNPNACGHIVTGGTEANILALWTAKRLRGNEFRNEVIVPESAHFSFDKAADLLGLKLVKVPLDSRFRVSIEDVERTINSRTLAIVGIAGTTGLGVVDPIDRLSELAVEHDLYLHVDAAFGGFLLPFLKELGYEAPKFDFSLEGVSSITVDPHKMGLVPIPAGGILFRNKEIYSTTAWRVSYMAGGETTQATLVGTRSGAAAIATWAMLNHLGRKGYRDIVKRCMELTLWFVEKVKSLDFIDIVVPPVMNIVGIKTEGVEIQAVAQKLRAKGWAIALFPSHIRIVIMPHVRKSHLEKFLNDLQEVIKSLGASKP
ncbi:MAG: tyrosine decarboxylase MfnA [Candidatus Hydrothermota bacterium]|nr:MAG: tyrosine decarboxylase MfnA [Candidatus Hydrothermae bacterium]